MCKVHEKKLNATAFFFFSHTNKYGKTNEQSVAINIGTECETPHLWKKKSAQISFIWLTCMYANRMNCESFY